MTKKTIQSKESILNIWPMQLIVVVAIVLTAQTAAAKDDSSIFNVTNRSDPAGDVMVLYANGTMTIATEDVSFLDIKDIMSSNDTENVTILLKLKGGTSFNNSGNVRYVIRIFTNESRNNGYNLTYQNGSMWITNLTNNITEGNASFTTFELIDSNNVLKVNMSISQYFTGVEFFDLDAYSLMRVPNKSYVDSITELSGNPGWIPIDIVNDTAPPPSNDKDEGSPGFGVSITLLSFVTISAVAVILLRKKL